MLQNADKIAVPAKGQFFALSVPELVGLIRSHHFAHSNYTKRIDIQYVNFCCTNQYGYHISTFYPSHLLIFCSFPEKFSSIRAKFIAVSVIREFASVGQRKSSFYSQWSYGYRKALSFRAYLSEPNKLTITQRYNIAQIRKYRRANKLSSVKRSIHSTETVFRIIELDRNV